MLTEGIVLPSMGKVRSLAKPILLLKWYTYVESYNKFLAKYKLYKSVGLIIKLKRYLY